MSKKEKKRSANYTSEEKLLLVNLIEKYKSIIECTKSGHVKWAEKEEAWKKIEQEFNYNNINSYRDASVLKEKYYNLKKDLKRRCSANKKSIVKIGGGSTDIVELDPAEVTLQSIVKEQIYGPATLYDCDANECLEIQVIEKDTLHTAELDVNLLHESETCPREINSSENSVENEIIDHDLELNNEPPTTSNNLGSYNSKMLKRARNNKFKISQTQTTKGKKLNDILLTEKINFIKLQRKTFEEEHRIQKEILEKTLKIKTIKLENLRKQLLTKKLD